MMQTKKILQKSLITSGSIAFALSPSSLLAEQQEKPNIVFFLVDDMGWSDLGCYGGEIKTPNIDSLAESGIRFTQCYNTAKCFPSRATLLTGIYAQQSGMDRNYGKMLNSVTLGEVLKTKGYRTLASGKHHGKENLFNRGFDHYFGLRDGCCNFWNPGEQRPGEPKPAQKRNRAWCDDSKTIIQYTPPKGFYSTDAFTEKALKWLDEKETKDSPFFLYLAFNAPHYPLHAWPEDIEKYKGFYDQGYQATAKKRYEKQIKMGLIDAGLSPIPEFQKCKDWSSLTAEQQKKETLRMQIYAAMLDRVDQNIGKVISKIKQQGKLKNTLFFFASDNGACAEGAKAKNQSTDIKDFGKINSYEVVGKQWATVQNTPLRFWKNYSYEGGICTPLIVSGAGMIKKPGTFCRQPVHFIDIMATLVDLTKAEYPESHNNHPVTPMQGTSILPALNGKKIEREKPLYWQWARGGAIRQGDIKAVFNNKKWELYNISKSRNECKPENNPEKLNNMKKNWEKWYSDVTKWQKKKHKSNK